MSHAMPYLRLMRPHQWVKNVLIPAPAFFAGAILYPAIAVQIGFAVLAFSLTASAVYALNDLVDREDDARHPKKRLRPIASGAITPGGALSFAVLLLLIGMLAARVVPGLSTLLLGYVFLNLIYSRSLKQIAVIDVIVVATFYVMRLVAGGIAAAVVLSPWIIFATFFLALFLVTGKRYGEFHRMEGRRTALDGYTRETLIGMLAASAALAIASYSVWTVLAHPVWLAAYTVIPVTAVVLRTLNHLLRDPDGAEAPELWVLRDPWTLALTGLWAVAMLGMLYLG